MEEKPTPNGKSKAAKMGEWLVTDMRDGSKPDLKVEAAKMSRGILSNWASQFQFALKSASVGAIAFGFATYFFGYTFLLGAIVGFILVGLIALASWAPR